MHFEIDCVLYFCVATKKTAKTTSRDTAALLLQGEGESVDFKRTPDSVSAEDLVSFANAKGGYILAGVDEQPGVNGAQVGVVVGCDVSDSTILQIANKALSCLPPIAINATVEIDNGKSFLKIDVPSSSTKPHCTPKGIYSTRDGRRNRALHPSELLRIFLESESRAFAERFEAAAGRITEELSQLESSLDESIQSMANQLGWADSKLGDTESSLDTIQAYVRRINSETNDLSSRLRALFRQDKRSDPIYERERAKLRDELIEQIRGDKKLLDAIVKGASGFKITASGKAAEELTKDDLRPIFDEALKAVLDEVEREKYTVEVKKPSDYSARELKAIASLIAKGGEVAGGIEARLKTADALGVIRYEKIIVGSGALKKPTPAYRSGVFSKAKATLDPLDFSRELGWMFVEEKHRGKGQMQTLITELLAAAKGKGTYATTRRTNDKMQRILKHHRFAPHGEAYPSVEHPDEQIVLLVAAPKMAAPKTEK